MAVFYKAHQALWSLGIFAAEEVDLLDSYGLKFSVGKGMVITKFSHGKPWYDSVDIINKSPLAWVKHVVQQAKQCGMAPDLTVKAKFVEVKTGSGTVHVLKPDGLAEIGKVPPASGQVKPLSEAKELYQPVKGTSGTSVYFMVGDLGPLKVAARYLNHTLSIRAEGDINKYKAWLGSAGFKQSDNHASMHLKTPDPNLASRALGAVLSDLSNRFSASIPMPKLSVINGKGS